MTLIEEITREIRLCNNELDELKMTIAIAKTQLKACEEKRDMLTMLLDSAQREAAKPAASEKKPLPPHKRKTSKAAADNKNDASADTDPEAIFSMKDVAHELDVETNTVAKICTELGYNDEMIKNNYKLTAKQMTAVRDVIEKQTKKGEL